MSRDQKLKQTGIRLKRISISLEEQDWRDIKKVLLKDFTLPDEHIIAEIENALDEGTLIDVDKNRVLDIIRERGGATAEQISVDVTGKSFEEQQRENISLKLHLDELEKEGKIRMDTKTFEWFETQ